MQWRYCYLVRGQSVIPNDDTVFLSGHNKLWRVAGLFLDIKYTQQWTTAISFSQHRSKSTLNWFSWYFWLSDCHLLWSCSWQTWTKRRVECYGGHLLTRCWIGRKRVNSWTYFYGFLFRCSFVIVGIEVSKLTGASQMVWRHAMTSIKK